MHVYVCRHIHIYMCTWIFVDISHLECIQNVRPLVSAVSLLVVHSHITWKKNYHNCC